MTGSSPSRGKPSPVGLAYRNPVHPSYFADPFVLRTGGGRDGARSVEYVAYGTGAGQGDRVFEVLHSSDLVTWTPVGAALETVDPQLGTDYWAPEVAEHDGRWWMYYSVGHGDAGQNLRVAVADTPTGPFRDCDVALTPTERFSIDAHPFRDHDGTWYLFYARDVLEGPRVGTMLAVDVLEEMTQLRGEPRSVLVPSDDWQLYQRQRELYGAVHDWHTLEGPFVVRRDGRYYCFYSGGSWQGPGYGMAYAVADHPLGPWVEPAGVPRVLRSVPGKVLGPGHASVVHVPGGGDVMVYHAWDPDLTARRMCIDPIDWTSAGPVVRGPSWEPTSLQWSAR